MNDEKQKILNIFDDNVKLINPINREKQEIIEKLLVETIEIEGKDNEPNN